MASSPNPLLEDHPLQRGTQLSGFTHHIGLPWGSGSSFYGADGGTNNQEFFISLKTVPKILLLITQ